MESNNEMEVLKQKVTDLEQRLANLEATERRNFSAIPRGAEADKVFLNFVEGVEPHMLQVVIRNTRVEDWARALVGMPLEPVLTIRNNVSVHAWNDLVGYAREVRWLRDGNSYRESILRTVLQLEEMGEIVLAREVSLVKVQVERLRVVPDLELDAAVVEAPKVEPAVKEWLESVLVEAGAAPLKRPSNATMLQV